VIYSFTGRQAIDICNQSSVKKSSTEYERFWWVSFRVIDLQCLLQLLALLYKTYL
jgi:hypothetical protein